MNRGKLKGLKVAILATDGFEQSELTEPRKALHEAGATTEVVFPTSRKPDDLPAFNRAIIDVFSGALAAGGARTGARG